MEAIKSVLLVGDNSDALTFLSHFLEGLYSTKTHIASSQEKSFEVWQDESPSYIIGHISENQDLVISFFKKIREGDKKTPFIILSSKKFELDYFSKEVDYALNWPYQMDEFTQILEKIGVIPALKSPEEYAPIPIDCFIDRTLLNCDLYIKLSKNHFIKAGDSKTEVDEEMLKGLTRKGIDFIYVEKNDLENFHRRLTKSFKRKLSGEKSVSEINKKAFDYIFHLLEFLNLTEDTILLVEEFVDHCLTDIQKNGMFDKLEVFWSKKFIASHSMILAYITPLIYKSLNQNAKESDLRSLVRASLFHDFYLTNDSHAKIESLESNEFQSLSLKDQEVIKFHPIYAADLAMKIFPEDEQLQGLILQHHEMPDGSGFPHKLKKHQLIALSPIFIISRNFLRKVFDNLTDKKFVEKELESFLLSKEFNDFKDIKSKLSAVFR